MNTRKTSIKKIAEGRGKTPAYIAKSKYGRLVKGRRIEAVENYDRACKEDFEHWVLHHRKETEKTAKELIDENDYYYVEPGELIWLTEKEHEEVHRKQVAVAHEARGRKKGKAERSAKKGSVYPRMDRGNARGQV